MNFTVINNSINFSDEFMELNKLRGGFLKLSNEAVNDFINKCCERFNNMEELSKDGETFGYEFVEEYLSKALEIIEDLKLCSIDIETFKEKYYYGRYCTWFSQFDEINDKYLLSKDDSLDIEVIRQEVKERRKKWCGDNFNVNEKVEENLKAGSLNKNSKLLNNKISIEMKDIITSINENNQESVNYKEVINTLANSMLESVFNIHLLIIDLLKDMGVDNIAQYTDFNEIDKVNKLLETLTEQEINKETEKIKELIELNPYNEEMYEVLLEKYGDKNNEVEELLRFLGYLNIGNYKLSKLDEYYKSLTFENEEDIIEAKEKIITFATNLHISEYQKYIDELDNKLDNSESISNLIIPKDEIENLEEVSKENKSENTEVIEDTNSSDNKNESNNNEDDNKIKNELEDSNSKIEDQDKNKKDKSLEKQKKVRICLITSLVAIIVLYLGFSFYFKNHFYFGTSIDNINVTGKTVDEVYDEVSKNATDYKLELILRGGETTYIKGSDFKLEYDFRDEIQKIKDDQNSLNWITRIFSDEDYNLIDGVSYNDDLLNEYINKLPCFDEENVVEPKEPELKYNGTSYELIKEIEGNKVNKEKLIEEIIDSIKNKKTSLDLEKAECYETTKYTSESNEVINAQKELNKYAKSIINYNVSGNKQVITIELTNKWFGTDDDFNIKFNENEVKKYVDELGNKYDKTGNIRQFGGIKFSTSSEIIKMNRAGEVAALIDAVKSGETIERTAKFSNNAVGNGIVNTFVEVDITKQHIWFYKNGKLITHGPTVTGNISKGHNTRVGVFKLKSKQRNTILKGDDYEVPVDFWMPFDGGIGIHDARWRGQFGGSIYKTAGSHGCVNTLYHVAEGIYNNINVGDYVVCHY